MTTAAGDTEIDESLYSRQIYTLGLDAMKKMAASNVLVSGMNGLGAEVAKNVILGGVRYVVLHDTENVTFADLSSQFYLSKGNIGENRATASLPKFSELNRYVKIEASSEELSSDFLSKFQVVVFCGSVINDHLLEMNEFCHKRGVKFILAATRGLFGQIFCDFGQDFTVVDPTGRDPFSCITSSFTRLEDELFVQLVDHDSIGFLAGNLVKFVVDKRSSDDETTKVFGPFEVKTVKSKTLFSIDGSLELPEEGQYVATAVKTPRQLSFKTLRESISEPQFLTTDYSKPGREKLLHKAFCSLGNFVGCQITPRNETIANRFVECVEEVYSLNDGDEPILKEFAYQLNSDLSPMNAVIGGIAAQEVFKSLSAKFIPITQWCYFDALECLSNEQLSEAECAPLGSRYDSQIAIFGRSFQERLERLRLFLVGSGAIGCEMLKSWAMMGIACSENGHAIVTDMDVIERSNLNRQFLFRAENLSQPKSLVAAKSSREMNPAFNIKVHQNKVGPETDGIYCDRFFRDLDAVVNALDNVPARRYIDSRCVLFQKPMLDSATMGTLGNTRMVIPGLTDCYSSEPIPKETSYALCTIKSFPYAIQHTLHWARELFDELFYTPMKYVTQYVEQDDFLDDVKAKPLVQTVEILTTLKRALIDNRPATYEDCVSWARNKWGEHFSDDIEQLIFLFPQDHKTAEGEPFWSASKRFPRSLIFDTKQDRHVDFVMSAANLMAFMYGIPQNRNRQEVTAMIENVFVPTFVPSRDVFLAVDDAEAEAMKIRNAKANRKMINEILALLPKRETLAGCPFQPVDFEKDDDSNFHLDFIVAASNSRAENYSIPIADRQKSKLIAGRIIPAIATTTSLVSGLVCLELIKLAQGHKDPGVLRNCYLDLAQPMMTFTEPDPPEQKPAYTNGGKSWTIWDRFVVSNQPTLGKMIDDFNTKHGIKIVMVNDGEQSLYTPFMTEEQQSARCSMTIRQLVETYKKIEATTESIRLDVSYENEKGEIAELPFIQYELF